MGALLIVVSALSWAFFCANTTVGACPPLGMCDLSVRARVLNGVAALLSLAVFVLFLVSLGAS